MHCYKKCVLNKLKFNQSKQLETCKLYFYCAKRIERTLGSNYLHVPKNPIKRFL